MTSYLVNFVVVIKVILNQRYIESLKNMCLDGQFC